LHEIRVGRTPNPGNASELVERMIMPTPGPSLLEKKGGFVWGSSAGGRPVGRPTDWNAVWVVECGVGIPMASALEYGAELLNGRPLGTC